MKNVIITGANSGLGLETAKKIAASSDDFRLILACRNSERGETARLEVNEAAGNENAVVMQLDTASLDSVRNFASEYKNSGLGSIHALLLNAGISGSHKGVTVDGFDIVFQTNHLGHFLLANLLLPIMDEDGLIFSTSSDMHDSPMGTMNWEGTDVLAHPEGKLANENMRYSYSKLCNLYFIYELTERLEKEGRGIKANAFNPGMMKTNFMPQNRVSMAIVKRTMPERFGDLDNSSTAYARLAAEEGLVDRSGLYYDRSVNAIKSSELSYNVENRRELWQKSAEYCGIKA